jgi:hypothetical protein
LEVDDEVAEDDAPELVLVAGVAVACAALLVVVVVLEPVLFAPTAAGVAVAYDARASLTPTSASAAIRPSSALPWGWANHPAVSIVRPAIAPVIKSFVPV